MFEFSVASKYLIPRRRQLSVSIIALLSILVISLVVWLVVTFLSVTHGIERRWIETLTALNAPVRLTPTQEYYNSYYYLVDQHSDATDYTARTIGEKLEGPHDPYDPMVDEALPLSFPAKDLDSNGQLKDPVRAAFAIVHGIDGAEARDFEVAMASMRLRLLRKDPSGGFSQSFLNQVSYLGAFDEKNPKIAKTLLSPEAHDLTQTLEMLSISGDNIREESPLTDSLVGYDHFQQELQRFFENVTITHLKPEGQWAIPLKLFPQQGALRAAATLEGGRVSRLFAGEGEIMGTISFAERTFTSDKGKTYALSDTVGMVVPDLLMDAKIDPESLLGARDADDLTFDVAFEVGGLPFAGSLPYRHLEIGSARVTEHFDEAPTAAPSWLYSVDEAHILPENIEGGHGVLIASSFRKMDVRVGDRGYLAYYSSTPSNIAEQKVPIFVAGFYDPGMMPAGAKLVLVDQEVVTDVRQALAQVDNSMANGIGVYFDDVYRAEEVKASIESGLEEKGLANYWTVETYREYEFAKPLLQQFQSDRLLFSLIALIIILVACSNIISMLILMVNDKRREIGILRAMGAKTRSIVLIFATCGTTMGILGSLVGILGALLTLRYLDRIIGLLSAMQGHEAFNQVFFGGELPNELSFSVLSFVIGATIVVSVIAGVIPALKAARIRPAAILRSE